MHHTPRILYIEDNALNRRLIRKLMKLHGFEYLEAEDGLQGVAVAAREHPDLILMDIHLPGIDGMEATSRLKSSSDLSHIPIIALTAAAMQGDRERIMAAGCDGYLQKPIDPDRVIATIRQYLNLTADPTLHAGTDRKVAESGSTAEVGITISTAVGPTAPSDTNGKHALATPSDTSGKHALAAPSDTSGKHALATPSDTSGKHALATPSDTSGKHALATPSDTNGKHPLAPTGDGSSLTLDKQADLPDIAAR